MPIKPVHSWSPVKKRDPDGGISSHYVTPGEARHIVADAVVETRGDFPVYRPGDIWRMLHGAVFQR